MIEAFCLHARFPRPELAPTRISDHQEGKSGLVDNRPVASKLVQCQCHSVVRLVVRATEAGMPGRVHGGGRSSQEQQSRSPVNTMKRLLKPCIDLIYQLVTVHVTVHCIGQGLVAHSSGTRRLNK